MIFEWLRCHFVIKLPDWGLAVKDVANANFKFVDTRTRFQELKSPVSPNALSVAKLVYKLSSWFILSVLSLVS